MLTHTEQYYSKAATLTWPTKIMWHYFVRFIRFVLRDAQPGENNGASLNPPMNMVLDDLVT